MISALAVPQSWRILQESAVPAYRPGPEQFVYLGLGADNRLLRVNAMHVGSFLPGEEGSLGEEDMREVGGGAEAEGAGGGILPGRGLSGGGKRVGGVWGRWGGAGASCYR